MNFLESLQVTTAAPLKAARLTALTLILTSFAGSSAMAFNTYHAGLEDAVPPVVDSGNTSAITNSPSPTMVDSCLPLLKSIHQTSPISAMDRNQRSAGKAAAVGLVFGVRFALSPPKKAKSSVTPQSKSRLDLWYPEGAFAGDRHALAVSAYRRCQKDKALQAMDEFRWSR